MTPKNLTRRRLLLQRLLEFLEQPDVFNGDDGLVGEGFQELDLRRGEGTHLGTTCAQCSNEFPLLTKGNGQEGAPVADSTPRREIALRRTSGIWSVPCSRIQRIRGSSILISTCGSVSNQNEPAEPTCPPRGAAAPRHRSHKPLPRSRRWRRAPAARPSASG